MQYPSPLACGRLIRRYKRFFVDIETEHGIITAHCANTGSMRQCAEPGWFAHYSDVGPNTSRKLRYSLEQMQNPQGQRIGVHTGRANTLVAEAIAAGLIPGLQAGAPLRKEVVYGSGASRVDFVCGEIYVEVKSVTLLEADGIGYFPDSVSVRASKHLRELREHVSAGGHAMLVYAVQHSGISVVRAAQHIDPAYAEALRAAVAAGVKLVALGAELDDKTLRLQRLLSIEL